MHWPFAISCFEPTHHVTGGIGSYTRLLLEEVSGLGFPVVFFTSARNRALPPLPDHVTVERLPELATFDKLPLNNLNDPYRHYAYNLYARVRELEQIGHSIGCLEVSDYCAEGYFVAKARRQGSVALPRLVVRLHSPTLMLTQDNESAATRPVDARRFETEEGEVYRLADEVLFGGDAMRDRVAALMAPSERAAFVAKTRKIHHPWPALSPAAAAAPDGVFRFGYVGRLEWRKGVDLLVRAAVEALGEVKGHQLEFHFYGRDTQTAPGGESMRALIDGLIPEARRGAFVFHDYVAQETLWGEELPKMSGIVFPSRFENYPNVLLETLPLGRPTLVSRHGCMPEMSQGFSNAVVVDPLDTSQLARQILSALSAPDRRDEARDFYHRRRAELHAAIRENYRALAKEKAVSPRPASARSLSVGVVVPHYGQARYLDELLGSVVPQLGRADRVIVVDDCSDADEASRAKAIADAHGAAFISTPKNSGPSVARNFGASRLETEALFFVDADDVLPSGALGALRGVIERLPDVDVASGFMRAFGDQRHAWAAYEPTPALILLENCCHCGIMIRRGAFETLGGYQAEQRLHYEDWEFHIRCVLAGLRFEIVPEVTYMYRMIDGAGRNLTNMHLSRRSHEQVLRHALAAVPSKRLAEIWPEISDLLVARLLTQGSRAPDELRYRAIDVINRIVKKTRIHGPLKRAARWTLSRLH